MEETENGTREARANRPSSGSLPRVVYLIFLLERARRTGHAALAGELAHALEIAMTLLYSQVEIDASQFLPESADVEIALDLADAGEFFLRPRGHPVSQRCAFHL